MAGDHSTHHRVGDSADLGVDGFTEVSAVGGGGSSTVYRARQDELDRTVAIKVMHAAWSIDTRERFERERQVMGRLSGHAAIVPIFQTGVTNRGEPYLVMPYYGRGSLFRLMQSQGPLPWREATSIIETLAGVIAECHRGGIVHRDVKPGNVLLTDHLQPRLSDFGITQPSGIETSGSAVAYTPSYSPPEAFTGGTADPTTDVYGLAATLWALLAGRAPFTEPGENVDAAIVVERAQAADLLPPAETTPAPILSLLRRAMAKDRSRRPRDGAEFAAELRRAIRLSERDSTGRSITALADRERRMSAIFVALIVIGVLVIAGGVGWMLAP